MRQIYISLLLVLIFCVGNFAQTNETAPCPKIGVTGPAGVVMPGEVGQFTADVDDKNKENYIFVWTLTGGKIIEEKGKDKIDLGIRVEEKGKLLIKFIPSIEVGGANVSATVKIVGLPQGCTDSASESMVINIEYRAILLDEFSISPNRINMNRLNNLADIAKVSKINQIAQIYIIEKFADKTSSKIIKEKNQKTIDYLKSKEIERERITLLNAFDKENITRFILVPAGASPPDCDDCVTIEPK